MSEYVECRACGFVLRSDGGSAPEPGRWDACPDCGGSEFRFSDR